MQLYLKLALGNVRRGARDYSVYFAMPDSAAWTAGCFAVVFAVNAVDGARDIAHMDRALINSINGRVAPTDDLYILGDFSYQMTAVEAVALRELGLGR